jgi:hypothetical protein
MKPSQYNFSVRTTSFHKLVRRTCCLHLRLVSCKMLTKHPLFALTQRRSVFTERLELNSKHDTDLDHASDSYWSSCHSRDLRLIPPGFSLCEICGGQKGTERVFFSPGTSVLLSEHHFTGAPYIYLPFYCFYQKEFWQAWEKKNNKSIPSALQKPGRKCNCQ